MPVGANIGINKTGADPERDYPALVARVKPYVQYIVLNVSSPNTPGLRGLQDAARLRGILDAIADRHPDRPRFWSSWPPIWKTMPSPRLSRPWWKAARRG